MSTVGTKFIIYGVLLFLLEITSYEKVLQNAKGKNKTLFSKLNFV